MNPTCVFERDGEKYRLEVFKNRNRAMLTDEHDAVVHISIHKSGNYLCESKNGWSAWGVKGFDEAVDRAVELCIQFRTQRTEYELIDQMLEYVEKCQKTRSLL